MHLCSRLKSDARRPGWPSIVRQGSAERPCSPCLISADLTASQGCGR